MEPQASSDQVEVDDALTIGRVCGGPRHLICPKAEFCSTPANTCPGPKQIGLCRPRPQICPQIFLPVCGCDGKTYPNACQANAAGVSVAHAGACSKPGACTSNGDCAADQYCATPAGTCGGSGTCTPRPQVCIQIFNPVCGCDGKTYGNSCTAASAGVNVASQGECPPVQTCGGFLGTPCPGIGKCVDDPSDDCDPSNGGADCGGICVCVQSVLCIGGTHFDSSPSVCACVPDAPPPVQTCGGFLGTPCPGAGKCIDDPSDDCDPNNGGADCGGLCVCVQTQLCIQGFHFDSSPSVCACVPDGPQTCGSVTCPAGQVCCNASCGICTPPGFACIQIACQ